MKKKLKKASSACYWIDSDGVRHDGVHTGIRGDASNISGNVSGIYGDVSDISGNVSDICGNVSDICGDIDDCDITDNDRAKGVNITDLVE